MRHRRSGTSLMEMVVVMAVLSIVMSLAVTAIARIVLAEKTSLRDLASAMAADRLGRQFRSDVHSARKAFVGDATKIKPAELELSFVDGTTVTWSRVIDGLRRRERAKQGGSSRVETYRVTAGRVRFVVESVGPGTRQKQLVSVRLLSEPSSLAVAEDGARRLTISGTLGYRLRQRRDDAERTTRKEGR